jgi:predicted TIM-barrel fold metal-dependent hydrolase
MALRLLCVVLALSPPTVNEAAISPYIDAHAHYEADLQSSLRAVLEALDRENATSIVLLTPPDTFDHPGHADADAMLDAAKGYRGKLLIAGGGATLNAMIQQVPADGVTPQIRKQFEDRAEELLREGAAGFGEITAEHFAGITPYQSAPADHPLLLLLAEIASRHGVPIDLHMEAVPAAMPLPARFKSPPNAPRLRENLSAFERLLAHDRRAKIIWAHAGADGTGQRTPALCRRLLKAHPNLSMELKVDPRNPGLNPLLEEGRIRPEWLQLFAEFPDRFVIGSDQHYPEPSGVEQQRWQAAVLLLNQLPDPLRRSIGRENALRIYARAFSAAGKEPK